MGSTGAPVFKILRNASPSVGVVTSGGWAPHMDIVIFGQTRQHSGRTFQQRSKRNAARLFDHLVGAGKERGRHVEAERLCGFDVDRKLKTRRLFYRPQEA